MRRAILLMVGLILAGEVEAQQAPPAAMPTVMMSVEDAQQVGVAYMLVARMGACIPTERRAELIETLQTGTENYRRRGSDPEWVGFVRGMALAGGALTLAHTRGMTPAQLDAYCVPVLTTGTAMMQLLVDVARRSSAGR